MIDDLCDPRWQEFGASLRGDQLYVKMPLKKAGVLLIAIDIAGFMTGNIDDPSPTEELLVFLRGEIRRATNQSLFYVIPIDQAKKDVEQLILIEPQARISIIKKFRNTLEAGLRNDPQVDWITRVGGPKPKSSTDDPKPIEAKPRFRGLFSL